MTISYFRYDDTSKQLQGIKNNQTNNVAKQSSILISHKQSVIFQLPSNIKFKLIANEAQLRLLRARNSQLQSFGWLALGLRGPNKHILSYIPPSQVSHSIDVYLELATN